MIDLSAAQRQLAEQGKPVRVVDESTHEAYILVREEFFEPITDILCLPDQEPPAGISPQMLRSMQAFWRDLPKLLPQRSRSRRFVAYHGDNRIGFGRSLTQLNRECLQRGLPRGEYGRHPPGEIPIRVQ
jgi:hypothetical protein